MCRIFGSVLKEIPKHWSHFSCKNPYNNGSDFHNFPGLATQTLGNFENLECLCGKIAKQNKTKIGKITPEHGYGSTACQQHIPDQSKSKTLPQLNPVVDSQV